MKKLTLVSLTLVFAAGAACGFIFSLGPSPRSTATVTVTKTAPRVHDARELTIYVQNFDRSYVPDQRIKDDMPVWERAANGAFRTVWGTPQLHLVFVPRGHSAPAGGEVLQIAANGQVSGAAAYHTINNGRPAIVVYAGIDDAYGVSLSVAATHEIFERLADATTSQINQGWPVDNITISNGQFQQADTIPLPHSAYDTTPQQMPINEVCDPVEAAHYILHDASGRAVWISDWVTPNWFNDEHNPYPGVVGAFDYLGLVQQPFTIMQGGYLSMYVVDLLLPGPLGGLYTGWVSLTNFRTAKDQAFFDAEKHGRQVKARSVLSRSHW